MQTLAHYQRRFDEQERLRPQAPEWSVAARRAALARFAQTGFPASTDEDWRATDVASIAEIGFEPASLARLDSGALNAVLPAPLQAMEGPRLVFVNGQYAEHLSRPSSAGGVEVGPLGRGLFRLEPYFEGDAATRKPFRALNAAFWADGALVVVPERKSADEPILLVHVTVPGVHPVLAAPRNVVLLGQQAQARVVEVFLGGGVRGARTLTAAHTEIRLGEHASLQHYRLQQESAGAFHVGGTSVEQATGSQYRSFAVADGAALSRHELDVHLAGEQASCTLNGLSLVGGTQLADAHSFVDHHAPRCTSEQLYKGILDGSGRGVFHGRVRVRPGAQKTDARQANRNLLLSDRALANAKPQLEINADDVKCTHGATVGQLDAQAIFYLRSRGIGEADARRILTEAFAGEVVQRMDLPPFREAVMRAVAQRVAREEVRAS